MMQKKLTLFVLLSIAIVFMTMATSVVAEPRDDSLDDDDDDDAEEEDQDYIDELEEQNSSGGRYDRESRHNGGLEAD